MTKPWEREQEQEQKPSFLSRFARDLGIGTRTAAEGAYDLISPFTNAAAGTMNLGLAAADAIPGVNAPYRFPEQSSAFSSQLSRAGLPEPETAVEKVSNVGGRLAAGAMAGRLVTPMVMQRLGFPVQPPPPSTEQLRSAAGQAYKAADDAGVVINQQSLAPVVQKMQQTAKNLGIDPTLHPRVTAALGRVSGTAGDLSFQELEILRRVVKNAASSSDPSERKIAQSVINVLDDYVAGLSPADVVSGDAVAASAAIQQARNLYSRSSKASEIEEMMVKARNSVSNFTRSGLENSLRTQFRQLANNPRRMRHFNPMERDAILRVVRGGRMDNALRYLGKLAPTGVISGGISAGTGFAVGGPAGAVAVPAAGLGARALATERTLANVRVLDEMVRRGAPSAETGSRSLAMATGASPAVVNFLYPESTDQQAAEVKKPWER